MIGRVSPSARARDAYEWRRSWSLTSSSPALARTVFQASSMERRWWPFPRPGKTHGFPGLRGRAASRPAAAGESETVRGPVLV